jgi:hypothetical protein
VTAHPRFKPSVKEGLKEKISENERALLLIDGKNMDDHIGDGCMSEMCWIRRR